MGQSTTRTVGNEAEQIALDFLLARNLELVVRNFHCRVGEIDLVMRHQDCLVFVEVRYRRPNRFASAAVSVDNHKQRKLAKAAAFFLGRYRQYGGCPVRFDVIALDGLSGARSELQWLQDAFRPPA